MIVSGSNSMCDVIKNGKSRDDFSFSQYIKFQVSFNLKCVKESKFSLKIRKGARKKCKWWWDVEVIVIDVCVGGYKMRKNDSTLFIYDRYQHLKMFLSLDFSIKFTCRGVFDTEIMTQFESFVTILNEFFFYRFWQ